jgi:acyl-coenzyme A synthetase/AMP-(fatty) acid ligase
LEPWQLTYSAISEVKTVLQITESTWDTEITDCITSADALIDSLLKYHDLTVPASTPQNIKDASAHFAAWLFRRRRDPVGAEGFWEEADKFLQAYIDAEEESYVGII